MFPQLTQFEEGGGSWSLSGFVPCALRHWERRFGWVLIPHRPSPALPRARPAPTAASARPRRRRAATASCCGRTASAAPRCTASSPTRRPASRPPCRRARWGHDGGHRAAAGGWHGGSSPPTSTFSPTQSASGTRLGSEHITLLLGCLRSYIQCPARHQLRRDLLALQARLRADGLSLPHLRAPLLNFQAVVSASGTAWFGVGDGLGSAVVWGRRWFGVGDGLGSAMVWGRRRFGGGDALVAVMPWCQ